MALSKSFLVIVTSSRLLISRTTSATLVDARAHGEWESSALAIYERGVYLVIILGRHRRYSTGQIKGQIVIFKYMIGRGLERSSTAFNLALPESDFPKHLVLSADDGLLSCVTGIHNKVLVWTLDEQFTPSEEFFAFSKDRYTQVRLL